MFLDNLFQFVFSQQIESYVFLTVLDSQYPGVKEYWVWGNYTHNSQTLIDTLPKLGARLKAHNAATLLKLFRC